MDWEKEFMDIDFDSIPNTSIDDVMEDAKNKALNQLNEPNKNQAATAVQKPVLKPPDLDQRKSTIILV